MANALLLHDKISNNGSLCEAIEKLGHKVAEVYSLTDAVECLRQSPIEIVFIEQIEEAAIASLAKLKNEADLAPVPVVVISSSESDNVIEVMRLGALDQLVRPSLNQLKSTIDRAIATNKLANKNQLADDILLGQSPAMRQVQKLIGMAASCDTTVIVFGETGTGKDKVAREIHKHSRHQTTPLTIVDCTAVPENYQSFQALSADASGTVILDEIGDLNSQTQALLVRALKEASVGSRIIATTQYNLADMVKEKKFREDLYYRLNVLSIHLPPLKVRGSDILALAELFLQQALPHSPKQLSSAAAKILLDYDWPGNVRELQNLIYHLSFTVRAEIIAVDDLEAVIKATEKDNLNSSKQSLESEITPDQNLDFYKNMADVEKRLLNQALTKANGSRTEAARLLGINRQLLYSKLKAHGLMKP